jgi:hypothetical protein
MNEVEKMYENAEIKKDWTAIGFGDIEDCYPPFTAEKQIELIEWLGELQIDTKKGYWHLAKFGRTTKTIYADNGNLGEALSEIVNQLWQDLTDAYERIRINDRRI